MIHLHLAPQLRSQSDTWLRYRCASAFPMSWNRGGFDSRGGQPDGNFPDNKIDSEDQTFKFNQMVFVGVGFHLPTTPKVSE